MNTLLVIDGNAIMHRAFHAIPPFKTKKGIPTNVIYGFFTMLYKAIQDFNPKYIVVCFDTPAQTFRQKLHKEYQAHRPEMADEFRTQIPLLKDLLDKTKIYREEQDGLEADDIIGTIVVKAKDKNTKILILTGDKDIMQLVDENVFVVSPQIGFSNTKIYNVEEVKKKLFVDPSQIPDWKALAGDPSDNYKGAKGIGPKTAARLVDQYKTLENIFSSLPKIKEEKIKKILLGHKKDILLAKQLSEIVTDAKISFDMKKARFDGFTPELKKSFSELEMNSLIQRFFNERPVPAPKPKKKTSDDQINLF